MYILYGHFSQKGGNNGKDIAAAIIFPKQLMV